MKKFLSVLCAAVLSAGVLAGCGGTAAEGNKVEDGATTIKIGLSYELSGGVATYGQSSIVILRLVRRKTAKIIRAPSSRPSSWWNTTPSPTKPRQRLWANA